jgi:hypothetical protein
MPRLRLVTAALVATVGIFGACSGSDPEQGAPATGGFAAGSAGVAGSHAAGSSGFGGTSRGSGGSAGASGSGAADAGTDGGDSAAGSDGGRRDANFPDVTFIYDGPTGDGAVTADSACVTATVRATSVPLDMYVMFDRSGSMNLPLPLPASGNPGAGDCNVGDTAVSRWCYAINALASFFRAPSSAGIGVALQFFPNGDCNSNVPFGYGCCSSGSCCNGGPDSTPEVALAALPGNTQSLIDALDAQIPWGDRTPIEAALKGLAGYTRAQRRTGREIVGLLITDGGPEGCESNPDRLASIVRNHRSTTGIRTFVMGVEGAVFPTLETIAIAGGAPAHTGNCDAGISPCHFYSVRDGTAAAFNNALQAIRRASIGCEFSMPTTDAGLINPENVVIEYFAGGTGAGQQIAKVRNAAGCSQDGFYYDDDASPSTLTLCPATCTRVQADNRARVDILLGCLGS